MSQHKSLSRRTHTFAKAYSKANRHLRLLEGPTDSFNKSLARRYAELSFLWARSRTEKDNAIALLASIASL